MSLYVVTFVDHFPPATGNRWAFWTNFLLLLWTRQKRLQNILQSCVEIVLTSNLHTTRDELLAHFSIPFWLHILIGQWYVGAKKRAKADWLMTCAKADWLTINVIIFPCSLIGQLIVCFKKRAKADWRMTCAKADWLRNIVMIFSSYLIG